MQIRGLPRLEADRAAFDIVVLEFLNRIYSNVPSDRRASCVATLSPGSNSLKAIFSTLAAWRAWALGRRRSTPPSSSALEAVCVAYPTE
jgi:hypothetical protein